jgi:uroporphyrinogen decarboxylase
MPDRVPMALGFYSPWIEAIEPMTPEEVFPLDLRFLEFHPPDHQDGFLGYLQSLPRDIHVGNLGQLETYYEWAYHPERGRERPLGGVRSIEELSDLILPDLTHPGRTAGLSERVSEWHRQGLAVAGGPPHLGGELFEMGLRLRGFEQFMEDLMVRKDLAHHLLDQLARMLIDNVAILVGTGIDILLLDDDVAMPTGLIISPAMWREFFKPRLHKAIQAARELSPDILVFYHSDGDFTSLIPELIGIGVDVINPLQPDCMDAAAVKTAFGDRLALWGTVGTALMWDQGSPREIRDEVRHRIATLGPEGLLISPAYDIDFAPLENIAGFVDAVEDFGRGH